MKLPSKVTIFNGESNSPNNKQKNVKQIFISKILLIALNNDLHSRFKHVMNPVKRTVKLRIHHSLQTGVCRPTRGKRKFLLIMITYEIQ